MHCCSIKCVQDLNSIPIIHIIQRKLKFILNIWKTLLCSLPKTYASNLLWLLILIVFSFDSQYDLAMVIPISLTDFIQKHWSMLYQYYSLCHPCIILFMPQLCALYTNQQNIRESIILKLIQSKILNFVHENMLFLKVIASYIQF